MLFFLEPLLIFLGCENLLAFQLKNEMQVFVLGIVHAFVIYLRKGIEFLSQSLKLGSLLCVLQRRELTEVGILRMKGEDAD